MIKTKTTVAVVEDDRRLRDKLLLNALPVVRLARKRSK